jgi:hypothetical protein
MWILRGRCRLHPLSTHLARRKVLILHGRRGRVSEGLLLLEAELGLLRRGLGAR